MDSDSNSDDDNSIVGGTTNKAKPLGGPHKTKGLFDKSDDDDEGGLFSSAGKIFPFYSILNLVFLSILQFLIWLSNNQTIFFSATKKQSSTGVENVRAMPDPSPIFNKGISNTNPEIKQRSSSSLKTKGGIFDSDSDSDGMFSSKPKINSGKIFCRLDCCQL